MIEIRRIPLLQGVVLSLFVYTCKFEYLGLLVTLKDSPVVLCFICVLFYQSSISRTKIQEQLIVYECSSSIFIVQTKQKHVL